MLFEQSTKEFSYENFQNPGACYRGAPFWSWNTLMTKEMIEEQILEFKKMGMGGFHIHVRVGLRNQYLSDEFLELVRFCNEKAKENGMLCWLYDEDRYSSGIAGGEVTKNVFFRARWLKLTPTKDEEMLDSYDEFIRRQERNEKVKGCFLRAYDVQLESGYLKRAVSIGKDDAAVGTKWYLYVELAEESPWCNNQTYVDTMKSEAIQAFINITHERYAKVLQNDFGKSIPAIFTDEPHINGLKLPENTQKTSDILLPYTETLPQAYGEVEQMDFFEAIPYIIWNQKEETPCTQRYHYYHTLGQMFMNAYCKQIGDWCDKHHLISTGHLLGEDSVRGQAATVCDAMRCYREFQLPGIDNLCDNRDFSAAKQAASIAHQYQKEGVLSELYGVTQWDFPFEGYKLAGDWQAALGINVRVPHLAWASMNGEAKRDYPAAIGWQSPWYKDYSYIEDYFARVNYCLTRGKPVVRIGMLHPVESFWLLQGPKNQSEGKQKQLEDDFQNITKWLLTSEIDFDYIAESSLADEGAVQEGNKFICGEMKYEVVLVPSCISLQNTTLDRLSRFSEAGGTIYFIGEVPSYVDCKKSEKLQRLIQNCECISLSKQTLVDSLEPWRDVDIWDAGEKRTHNLLYQLREEKDCQWLFIAQAFRGMESRQSEVWYRRALHQPQDLHIVLKGKWSVHKYDTITGKISEVNVDYQKDKTIVFYKMYGDDSLLLHLTAFEQKEIKEMSGDEQKAENIQPDCGKKVYLPEPFAYKTSEPNVLLLDYFEYALDQEEYQESCEILKLDNKLRERLHFSMRCEALAQPYIREMKEARNHKVRLRTVFFSEAELTECCLALEETSHCSITLNGQSVDRNPVGYYVDKAITTRKLPTIQKGENKICLEFEYGECTDLERIYILGEFGVNRKGRYAYLTQKPEMLFWGDYTRQGFPFYTGNMTYLVNLPDHLSRTGIDPVLQVPYYSGAAVKVSINQSEEQMLALLPYKCKLTNLSGQNDLLQITCLGNRYNGFGQLHLIGDDMYWLGADSWRSEGTSWTDGYQTKPMGVLTAPLVEW